MIKKIIQSWLGNKKKLSDKPSLQAGHENSQNHGLDKAKIHHKKTHRIDKGLISDAALKTIQGLQKSGHKAYIVGGAVRDLLLNQHPKDFDVATDATPEQVRNIFRRSRIIGRRFRLVHVLLRYQLSGGMRKTSRMTAKSTNQVGLSEIMFLAILNKMPRAVTLPPMPYITILSKST
jgi:hypothetical protein